MNKPINLDETVTIPEEVAFEKVGDEAVLLHLESGVYYGLDPVGSRVWELLAASGKPREVLARMEEEYDVAPDTLQQDVEHLLRELLDQNLITVQAPA